MHAICGADLSPRADHLVLGVTALAVVLSVIAPMLYVAAVPVACAAGALAAPPGRRTLSAVALWIPVSAGVVLGVAPIG